LTESSRSEPQGTSPRDPPNSGETTQPPRQVAWLPYVVGAVVGALVTIGIVALLGGFDSDDEGPRVANTTTPATRPTPTSPTTSATTPGTSGPPPEIVGFGVATTNCPAGASSTTVRITYQTVGASTVNFTVDGGPQSRADDTSGSRDIGPIPCDAQRHVVTLIAEGNGQRATRDATVSVS
jgi:hypothetical protein